MALGEIHAARTGSMIAARYQPIVRIADGAHRFMSQIEDAGLAAAWTETVARRAFADTAGAAIAPPIECGAALSP
jgi:hypothetical protein